jgi:hypothetical protein
MYSPTQEYVVPRSIPIAGPELDMMCGCVCVAGYQEVEKKLVQLLTSLSD